MAAWWYSIDNQKSGPVEAVELERLIGVGTVKDTTLVWTTGQAEWLPLKDVAELSALLNNCPPPLPPPLPVSPTDAPPAGAWRRLFARTLDNFIGLTLALPILVGLSYLNPSATADILRADWFQKPGVEPLLVCLLLPVGLALDAIIYMLFGNTAGKSILGIHVLNENRQRLTGSEYLGRNFRLWVAGLAFAIPLVSLITMVWQARRLGSGLPASYDATARVRVTAAPIGWGRRVGYASLFLAMPVCGLFFGSVAGGLIGKQALSTVADRGQASSSKATTPAVLAPQKAEAAPVSKEPAGVSPSEKKRTLSIWDFPDPLEPPSDEAQAAWDEAVAAWRNAGRSWEDPIAIQQLKKAFALGHPKSLYVMATEYYLKPRRSGAEANVANAVFLLEGAAKLYPARKLQLAQLYAHPEWTKGVPEDLDFPSDRQRAVMLLNELVAERDPEGMYFLGLEHSEGEIVRRDLAKARSLYRAAAILGHGPAMQAIGEQYADRSKGNFVIAAAWCELARQRENICSYQNPKYQKYRPDQPTQREEQQGKCLADHWVKGKDIVVRPCNS